MIHTYESELEEKVKESLRSFSDAPLCKFRIRSRIIYVSAPGWELKIVKWFNSQKKYTIYSVSGQIKGGYDEELMKHLLLSTKEYIDWTVNHYCTEGALFIKNNDDELPSPLGSLLSDIYAFDCPQKNQLCLAAYFSLGTNVEIIAGTLKGGVLNFIELAKQSIDALKHTLAEIPLLEITDMFQLNRLPSSNVVLRYYGEEIEIELLEDQNVALIHLRQLDKVYKYPLPLKQESFKTMLDEIKEDNKLKNLLSPKGVYFEKFIEKFLRPCVAKDEFSNIASCFDSWEIPEMLFKKAYEQGATPEKPLLEECFKSEVFHRCKIIVWKMSISGYDFWFVQHRTQIVNDKLKAFVSNTGEKPLQLKTYVSQCFSEIYDVFL